MQHISVQGFADELRPFMDLSCHLGAPAALVDLRVFEDGEIVPTVPVTDARTVVLYASLHHPPDRLLRVLLAADAYRRIGVRRLVLAAPYLCGLRQDKVFKPGEPLSRDVFGKLLGEAFDRIVTVQAHMHRTDDLSKVYGTTVDNIDVSADLARPFAEESGLMIVGPDVESTPWVRSAAAAVGADWIAMEKVRDAKHGLSIKLHDTAKVEGRRCLLLDDICSSGGTLALAARLLHDAKAESVDAAVVHAFFDGEAQARLLKSGIGRIISSDSVPHPTNRLALAPILARGLLEECSE